MPSTLTVRYDGRRRGREFVVIEPHSLWGERAYGLPPAYDFVFSPGSPKKGQKVDLRVSDETFRLLRRQRQIREDARARRKTRGDPPWARR